MCVTYLKYTIFSPHFQKKKNANKDFFRIKEKVSQRMTYIIILLYELN